MDIKAWWNEKRRYPSGDVFSRGETIIYGALCIVGAIVLLALFLTLVPWLFLHAYEGYKADFLYPRPIGEVFQRNRDFVVVMAPWVALATGIYVLIIKLRPRLKFTALKRWMHRNQST